MIRSAKNGAKLDARLEVPKKKVQYFRWVLFCPAAKKICRDVEPAAEVKTPANA